MFLFIFFLVSKVYALAPLECGEYEFKGRVLKSKEFYDVVINEKTMSEYRLSILPENILAFTPYLGRTIKGTVLFEKTPELKQTKVGKFLNLEIAFPDAIYPNKNTYIRKVNHVECQK